MSSQCSFLLLLTLSCSLEILVSLGFAPCEKPDIVVTETMIVIQAQELGAGGWRWGHLPFISGGHWESEFKIPALERTTLGNPEDTS